MDELVKQALRELPGGQEVGRLMSYEGLQNLNELANHIGVNVDELLRGLREGEDITHIAPRQAPVLAPR